MDRKVAVLAVVFALTVGSDGALKCYVCDTVTNSSCSNNIMNCGIKPVECTSANIEAFSAEAMNHPILKKISKIFETDAPPNDKVLPDLACAKMDMTVDNQKLTIRSCQIAKTESMDPCEVVKGQLAKLTKNDVSSPLMPTLEFCGVCKTDACNNAIAMVPKTFYMIFPVITALALANGNYIA